jgi:hypothetical protein
LASAPPFILHIIYLRHVLYFKITSLLGKSINPENTVGVYNESVYRIPKFFAEEPALFRSSSPVPNCQYPLRFERKAGRRSRWSPTELLV